MQTVDARGLSCPEPVLMTKKEVDSGNKNFTVLVDLSVAMENVSRFLENSGYNVKVSQVNSEYKIDAKKQ